MFCVATSFYQSFRNMSILLPDLFLICEKYYTLPAGVVLGRRFRVQERSGTVKRILWMIEACFLVLEAAKEIYYAIDNGGYRWDMFPMQICSIVFIVLPVALVCRDGFMKDSILGFIGFCSLEGAVFYLCNPTAAMNAQYILLSVHSFLWHWMMILTGTFIIVSFDLLRKEPLKILLGSYTVWFVFAIAAAVVNNIANANVPQLHIDYYHIGYVKVVYPLLNLIFPYPKPYMLFFLSFLVYFALGTAAVYYAARGICRLNHIIFRKDGRRAMHEIG